MEAFEFDGFGRDINVGLWIKNFSMLQGSGTGDGVGMSRLAAGIFVKIPKVPWEVTLVYGM